MIRKSHGGQAGELPVAVALHETALHFAPVSL